MKGGKPWALVAGACTAGFCPDAGAYLDPASGSMLLSALVGVAATVAYLLKGFYYRLRGGFSRQPKRPTKKSGQHELVFFSEGRQYWSTFKPVIEALANEDVAVSYLTMDEADEGLQMDGHGLKAECIGDGRWAFVDLNAMQADLCVMTTPGLDVLQIRRSPLVKHYAHLIHAPTTGTYKLFSFDYFDSVLCSGQHQINAIRELETARGTQPKLLLQTGCAYMDVLAQKLDATQAQVEGEHRLGDRRTVLIAPSWGENALLNRFGAGLIRSVLEMDYEVILRPHPQSHRTETELLDGIRQQLIGYTNLRWDDAADGFDALFRSDLMISDMSGVVFDYAFVFEKPVITVNLELDLRGLEANHLADGLWEVGVLDEIGIRIDAERIGDLPRIINDLPNGRQPEDLRRFRDRNLFNYRRGGAVAAQQLLTILRT